MIRAFIAVCLLCQALNAQQEETQTTDTAKTQTSSDSKSTSSSAKSASSKQTPKKNTSSIKQSPETASSPPPLSAASKAAIDSVAALDSAIRLVTANGEQVSNETSAKLTELRTELNSSDPKTVASEAAKWTAQVYQVKPTPVKSDTAPATDPPRPAPSVDLIWALLLISLTSPLICIGGFWFGSRIADHNLRRHLREAGLL